MDKPDIATVEALIVALPETAGSALYGMIDVLSATGTLWRELVGEEPGASLIHPCIVAHSGEPFLCGNNIPINNQSRCTVVVIRRNPKDDHVSLLINT